MTMYDPSPGQPYWSSPRRRCAALAALAMALALLPPRWTQPVKSYWAALLRPGLVATHEVARRFEALCVQVRGVLARADDWARIEQQLERLQTRNRELEAASVVLTSRQSSSPDGDLNDVVHPPLLTPRLVEARVLGRQAQAFLSQSGLLDIGLRDGASPDALVIDVPALVDRGSPSGVAPGDLVLAGRCVWGKVLHADDTTSRIRRATEAGYRDLVQVGQRQQGHFALGPRGVLEGTGEPLCRIRLTPVTEAVSVGDVVLTDGGEGLLPWPLVYGEVVRVERPAGASHWEIWMRPALAGSPQRVAVLSAQLSQRTR